jgi:hypothetical protein
VFREDGGENLGALASMDDCDAVLLCPEPDDMLRCRTGS